MSILMASFMSIF